MGTTHHVDDDDDDEIVELASCKNYYENAMEKFLLFTFIWKFCKIYWHRRSNFRSPRCACIFLKDTCFINIYCNHRKSFVTCFKFYSNSPAQINLQCLTKNLWFFSKIKFQALFISIWQDMMLKSCADTQCSCGFFFTQIRHVLNVTKGSQSIKREWIIKCLNHNELIPNWLFHQCNFQLTYSHSWSFGQFYSWVVQLLSKHKFSFDSPVSGVFISYGIVITGGSEKFVIHALRCNFPHYIIFHF